MNYKKMWDTLKAESGGRWCQPHPGTMELIYLNKLMGNMEEREKLNKTQQTHGEICRWGLTKNDNWDNEYYTNCGNSLIEIEHNKNFLYCGFCGRKLHHE